MKIEIITNNENETILVAEKFSKSISFPCIISLEGDLGAGKTTFVKGFAKGLGIKEIITSPTFTILNEYIDNDIKLFHFDMYRIESIQEITELGFENYFDLKSLKKAAVFVEWAINTPQLLPKNYFIITFEVLGENKRKIIIQTVGKGQLTQNF